MSNVSHILRGTCPTCHLSYVSRILRVTHVLVSHVLRVTCLMFHMSYVSHVLRVTCSTRHLPYVSHIFLRVTCHTCLRRHMFYVSHIFCFICPTCYMSWPPHSQAYHHLTSSLSPSLTLSLSFLLSLSLTHKQVCLESLRLPPPLQTFSLTHTHTRTHTHRCVLNHHCCRRQRTDFCMYTFWYQTLLKQCG